MHFFHVVLSLLRSPEIGLADDFHKGYPGAVQIDVACISALLVDQFPRVFLQVDTGNADSFQFSPAFDIKMPVFAQRSFILGDLVGLGQIWIEIVLTSKLGIPTDTTVCR